MAQIQIDHLDKRFGSVQALNQLSLEVADREFLVLLGPSGAGKTTTLRCVAGVEPPDRGDISFDGRSLRGVTPAERDVAFVFQSYALYPHMTVFENIAFPLEARRYSPQAISEAVMKVADTLHIRHLLQRRPAQLSGGEQQRVALGRAMVRRPRAFLMDEPLTNLDFQLRVEMRAELKRIHHELNTTLLYVTNDQTEAMSLADRIAVLNRGVLQQVGTPEQVYEQPVNRFVASFIGSLRMNFLECVLHADPEPMLRGTHDQWRLPIPRQLYERIRERHHDERLILGVRPEDVEVTDSEADGLLAAEVYAEEPLGDRTIYDLRLGNTPFKVRMPPSSTFAQGSRVWLRINTERIHLFDPRTDQAIR